MQNCVCNRECCRCKTESSRKKEKKKKQWIVKLKMDVFPVFTSIQSSMSKLACKRGENKQLAYVIHIRSFGRQHDIRRNDETKKTVEFVMNTIIVAMPNATINAFRLNHFWVDRYQHVYSGPSNDEPELVCVWEISFTHLWSVWCVVMVTLLLPSDQQNWRCEWKLMRFVYCLEKGLETKLSNWMECR